MNWLFLIFLTLSPFSPLFFRRVDLWFGAGQYFQVGILLLFAYSFFEQQKEVKVKNLPLALLTAYLGLNTLWYWYQCLVVKQVDVGFLFVGSFFNFICFLLFYKLSFQLNRKWLEKIVTYLRYSLSVYLLYCVLQYFDFDQLFKVAIYSDGLAIHRMVGFVGNETQNASYLAMCLPLFYYKADRFSILCAILTWIIIAILGSATGLVTALIVTIFFSLFYRLPIYYYCFLLLGAIGCYIKFDPSFLNPTGRFDIWERITPLIKERGIFGRGLGTFNLVALKKEFLWWRHAHNEYWQLWFTTGIIGLVSVLYCIYEYFRGMLKDRLAVTFASMFLGFCLVSLLYFPGHLWLLSTIAMISYSFMFVLKGEKNAEYSKRVA